MIRVNIAFDDKDPRLGSYFQECKEDLISFLEDRRVNNADDYAVDEIHSGRCNQVYIDNQISIVNANNFLFIAYSHGDDACLSAGGSAYIHSSFSGNLFNNAFFYAVACSTGSLLGPDLVNNGCHVFIGYNGPFYVLHMHHRLAVNCANVGIKMFFMGHSVRESFNLIESFYNQEIDKLVAFHDPLAASFLISNKNALVLLGGGELTIDDFDV